MSTPEPVRSGGSLPSLPARPTFPVDMNLHQPLNLGAMEDSSSDIEDQELQDAACLPVMSNGAAPPLSQPSSLARACEMSVFAPPASCFSRSQSRAEIVHGLHPLRQTPMMDVEEVSSSSDQDVGGDTVFLPTLGLQNGVAWPKLDVPSGSLSSDDDAGEGFASAGLPTPYCPQQLPADDLAQMLEDTHFFPGSEGDKQVYLPSLGHVTWPQVDAPRPAVADFASWDDRLRLPEEESPLCEDPVPDSMTLTPKNLEWMQATGHATPSSLQHLLPAREVDEKSETGSMVGSAGTCLDSSSDIAFADTLVDDDVVGDNGLDAPSQLQSLDPEQAWQSGHFVVNHSLYRYIYIYIYIHTYIHIFSKVQPQTSVRL